MSLYVNNDDDGESKVAEEEKIKLLLSPNSNDYETWSARSFFLRETHRMVRDRMRLLQWRQKYFNRVTGLICADRVGINSSSALRCRNHFLFKRWFYQITHFHQYELRGVRSFWLGRYLCDLRRWIFWYVCYVCNAFTIYISLISHPNVKLWSRQSWLCARRISHQFNFWLDSNSKQKMIFNFKNGTLNGKVPHGICCCKWSINYELCIIILVWAACSLLPNTKDHIKVTYYTNTETSYEKCRNNEETSTLGCARSIYAERIHSIRTKD